MRKLKVKVTKDGSLYYTGEKIGNHYWAGLTDHILARAKLPEEALLLIGQGKPFCNNNGTIDPDTDPPDIDRVWERSAINADEALKLTPTPFYYALPNGPTCTVFHHPAGYLVPIKAEYEPLWEGCALYQSVPEGAITIYDDEWAVAIVMPVRTPDLGEIMRALVNASLTQAAAG